jgi:hypothetical protein
LTCREEAVEAEKKDAYDSYMTSSIYLQRKRLVRRLARLRRRKEYEMVPLFTCRGRGW